MNTSTPHWQPDILGTSFESAQFPLHPDSEGCAITTLIRHTPSHDTAPQPTVKHHTRPFAFLYIHGWNDYFYHPHLARYISSMGGHFYAIDLRKYGRSHLQHQSWGYITNLSHYDEELHIALDTIYAAHGCEIPIVLYGHSTGGLTATLWAHRHPGVLSALILNSPWLELQAPIAARLASENAIERLAQLAPTAILPIPDNGLYHRTITGNHLECDNLPPNANEDPFFTAGWQPDESLRNTTSFAVRAGWFNAILTGHKTVAAGLSIDEPILVLTSARSIIATAWSNDLLSADSVLTVENIWKRVPHLGTTVTLEKLDGAIHDVILSRKDVRDQAFTSINRFLKGILD